jgi:hypothetical protein
MSSILLPCFYKYERRLYFRTAPLERQWFRDIHSAYLGHLSGNPFLPRPCCLLEREPYRERRQRYAVHGNNYLHCGQTSGYVAQKILYNGAQSPGYYQGLVVDTIQFNGASNLYKDPTGQNTGLGFASQPMLIQ